MMNLTKREEQLLVMASDGLSYDEMAAQLGRNHETIKGHLWRLRKKTGAKNTTHAVSMYKQEKFFEAFRLIFKQEPPTGLA